MCVCVCGRSSSSSKEIILLLKWYKQLEIVIISHSYQASMQTIRIYLTLVDFNYVHDHSIPDLRCLLAKFLGSDSSHIERFLGKNL